MLDFLQLRKNAGMAHLNKMVISQNQFIKFNMVMKDE